MGSIKRQPTEKEHELTNSEFNYLANITTAKKNTLDEYDRTISAFLKYITTSRLGYKDEENLQFELDFGSKQHILKVTRLT